MKWQQLVIFWTLFLIYIGFDKVCGFNQKVVVLRLAPRPRTVVRKSNNLAYIDVDCHCPKGTILTNEDDCVCERTDNDNKDKDNKFLIPVTGNIILFLSVASISILGIVGLYVKYKHKPRSLVEND